LYDLALRSRERKMMPRPVQRLVRDACTPSI